MDKNKPLYLEDLDVHVQEIIIQLLVSIIENKKKHKQEETV